MGSVNQFYRGCLCANISSLLKSAVFNRYRPYDSFCDGGVYSESRLCGGYTLYLTHYTSSHTGIISFVRRVHIRWHLFVS